ncbi:hypothetical protein VNI00_003361 [Paramarasmius palmivorus]|uniref:Uncharacterized protein n=1 Tax=Paramarasmius palmivorus TaxID=297713 RepID=A0AAW0DQ94_9AGAR
MSNRLQRQVQRERFNGIEEVEITVKATRQLHIESTVRLWKWRHHQCGVYAGSDFLQRANVQGQCYRSAVEANITMLLLSLIHSTIRSMLTSNFLGPDLRNWTTFIDHSYNRAVQPSPLILATTIQNHQPHTGGNFGNGTNNNTFSYSDAAGNTYNRRVNAAFNNITLDVEGGSLASSGLRSASLDPPSVDSEQAYFAFAGAHLPGGLKVQVEV